jgi:hypothetical protein
MNTESVERVPWSGPPDVAATRESAWVASYFLQVFPPAPFQPSDIYWRIA